MKILQIVPAHGVIAEFENKDGTKEQLPVVAWALIEIHDGEGPLQYVRGMVLGSNSTSLEDVTDVHGFIGYLYT